MKASQLVEFCFGKGTTANDLSLSEVVDRIAFSDQILEIAELETTSTTTVRKWLEEAKAAGFEEFATALRVVLIDKITGFKKAQKEFEEHMKELDVMLESFGVNRLVDTNTHYNF